MVTDTPDGWWSSVVTRAFEAKVSEAYVAWSDLKALREENARLTQRVKELEREREGLAATIRAWPKYRYDSGYQIGADSDQKTIRDSIARAEAEVARLEGLILDWVNRYDKIEKSDEYRSVWEMAQIHQGPYRGEQWNDELNALRAQARRIRAAKGE